MSSREDDPALDELEAEVEADFQLIVESGVDESGPGSPSQWLVDPEEVQDDAVALRSLRGAVEALESDRRDNPGTVCSG